MAEARVAAPVLGFGTYREPVPRWVGWAERSIGPDSEVRDGAWLKSGGSLVIGTGVTIGPDAGIHCTDTSSRRISWASLSGSASPTRTNWVVERTR